jgi:predicted phosphoribosyltransferase
MEAANLLSEKIKSTKTVIGSRAIPRGGVPLGYEIARNLQLPPDTLFFQKNWSSIQ